MHAEILAICQAATVNAGMLNILGTFDILSLAKFPGSAESFSIATTVRFGPEEAGPHSMRIDWVDPDGATVDQTGTTDFEINFLTQQDIIHFIWHVMGKEFFAPSEYLLQLVVDDIPVASVPLVVKGM
ncbi:MAG: hypothetical protein KDN20_19520 [Verrucomicrobiae bacterium]|nr:hypothetical protein [Verrucomicrobiae bacterium]